MMPDVSPVAPYHTALYRGQIWEALRRYSTQRILWVCGSFLRGFLFHADAMAL